MSDKLSLIASMAATLEAGDRAHETTLIRTPEEYVERAYDLYFATIEEIRVRDESSRETMVALAERFA